jgi:hypothetical protein
VAGNKQHEVENMTRKENRTRAARARRALTEYRYGDDTVAAITDLMADLCHLAAAEHLSIEPLLATALMHYNDEAIQR